MNKTQQLSFLDDMPIEGHVFWLKVPEYQVPWLMSHYGLPCVFPSYTQEAGAVRWGLTANKGRSRINDCCLTHEMWMLHKTTLSDSDRLSWLPIAMPERILRHGTYLRPTDRWQLSRTATIELRELIRYHFWCDLAAYINDTTYTAVCHKQHITLDQQFFDWMELHDIDWSYADTLLRQYHRDRQNGEKEVSDRLTKYTYDISITRKKVLEDISNYIRSDRYHTKRIVERIKKHRKHNNS